MRSGRDPDRGRQAVLVDRTEAKGPEQVDVAEPGVRDIERLAGKRLRAKPPIMQRVGPRGDERLHRSGPRRRIWNPESQHKRGARAIQPQGISADFPWVAGISGRAAPTSAIAKMIG